MDKHSEKERVGVGVGGLGESISSTLHSFHILGRAARRTRILLFVVTCIDDTVYKIMLSADKHNSHFNIIMLHVDIILLYCKCWKYPIIL